MPKKTGTITEQEKKEQKLNRQINFLVMREMWQVVRGRASSRGKGTSQTIYDAFGISRGRYSRAIDGSNIRISREEIERLMVLTGLSRQIFQGQDCFRFEDITRKNWAELFQIREYDIEKFEEHKDYLFSLIKSSDDDLVRNGDFYRYMRYLEHKEIEVDFPLAEAIGKYTEWARDVKVSNLEKCPMETLKSYYDELQRQSDIVGTVLHYAELRRMDT